MPVNCIFKVPQPVGTGHTFFSYFSEPLNLKKTPSLFKKTITRNSRNMTRNLSYLTQNARRRRRKLHVEHETDICRWEIH